jgi:hypothetical protein
MVRRLLLMGLALVLGASWLDAQSYSRGQNASPAFEGWEQNADGSFNLLFGYMNRNWDEELYVPIGPDNNIEPGGPDQGQPTRFLPRRNRFVFRVRVPKDWGQKELVWTLTTKGKTEKAYASLRAIRQGGPAGHNRRVGHRRWHPEAAWSGGIGGAADAGCERLARVPA